MIILAEALISAFEAVELTGRLRVIALQREADDRLRTEEADLLNRLSETEAALAELNQDEDGNPLGQLTPEIQAEIDRFNGEMLILAGGCATFSSS